MSACLPATGMAASEDPPVFAVVIEGLFAGPFLADDVEIFVRPGVALVLGQMVAVLRQLIVGAAGDDVHRDASARELVQRRQLPRRHGGRREAGTVGDHEAQVLGHRRRMRGRQDAFRRGGAKGDQGSIKPAVVVGLGDGLDIVSVERRARARMNLGSVLEADEANEFDGHGDDLLRKMSGG